MMANMKVSHLMAFVTKNLVGTLAINKSTMASKTLTLGIDSYLPLKNTKALLPFKYVLYICYLI